MRPLPSNAFGRMEGACRALLQTTPDDANWNWDREYHAALLILRAGREAALLEQLGSLMPWTWTRHDIGNAPSQVRHVCGIWGGLMVAQRLFVLDPDDDPMLFASWWPWGNRQKFSLRVGCYARSDVVIRADPQRKLQAALGL